MATALLIIDVQRALCTGEYECFEIKRVIENINDLSAKARWTSMISSAVAMSFLP